MNLQTLAAPAAIPADAVELLRRLVTIPGTPERTLEQWIREFPQVIGISPEFLWPHVRFRLPGEPERLWEPDILYSETERGFCDLIELKRADRPMVAGGRGSVWLPSSPPKFSSYAASAISQMQIYISHATEHREFLEKAHSLRLFVPRGLIIAGQETDVTTSRNLRLLLHGLPGGIQFLTWTAILRRAEQLKAYKVMINLPCTVTDDNSTNAFECGFHKSVTAGFHPWTGFTSPYVDPLNAWEKLLAQAHQEVAQYEIENDIHENDETFTEYTRFRGQVLAPIYYRLGKYCIDEEQFLELWRVLPGLGNYVNRRSFEKFFTRLNIGFADTQHFLTIGAAPKTVSELETAIATVVAERQSGKLSNGLQEPESYYRRVITYGFLKAKLLGSDLNEVLRVGGWTNRTDSATGCRASGCVVNVTNT